MLKTKKNTNQEKHIETREARAESKESSPTNSSPQGGIMDAVAAKMKDIRMANCSDSGSFKKKYFCTDFFDKTLFRQNIFQQ